MRKGIALLTLAVLCGSAAAQDVNADKKLRQAAWMPTVSIKSGISFSTERGFSLVDDKPDWQPRIAALRKQLQGNASDADRYFRLRELYEGSGDEKAAEKAARKAVKLYRPQVKAAPDDNRLLTRLAICLDSETEQETLLRRVVKRAPGEYAAWLALGVLLQAQGFTVLGLDSGAAAKTDLFVLLVQLSRERPAQERIDRALKLFAEARGCFDKVLAAKPPEADVYSRTGMCCCWGNLVVRCLRGKEGNLMRAFLAPEFLVYFRRAAELDPDDYRLIGWATFYEAIGYAVHHDLKLPNTARPLLDALPKEHRQAVTGNLARLEKLAQGRNKAAAACSELLGTFTLVLKNDPRQCAVWYGRAVERDPTRDKAWELLLAALGGLDRDKEVLATSQKYVKYKDTAHTRYFVAKAHEALRQWDKAKAEVRLALKRDPNSLEATLGLAALLLRGSDRGHALDEAGRMLDRAEQLLKKEAADSDYRLHCDAHRGIYLALKRDRDAARRLLEGVLKKDNENKTARAALDALGK